MALTSRILIDTDSTPELSPAMDSTEYFDKHYSPGLFRGRRRKKELKELIHKAGEKSFELLKAENILDVGFFSLAELQTLGDLHEKPQIVGVDVFNKKMKRMAREIKDIPSISVIRGDINHLEFEPMYFDLVYCLNVLYLALDLKAVLKTLFTILRKKSHLVIELDITDTLSSPNQKKYDEASIPYLRIGVESLKTSLREAGFHAFFDYTTLFSNAMIVAYKKN